MCWMIDGLSMPMSAIVPPMVWYLGPNELRTYVPGLTPAVAAVVAVVDRADTAAVEAALAKVAVAVVSVTVHVQLRW